MTDEVQWKSKFEGREWVVVGDKLLSRDPETGIRSAPHGTFGEPVTIRRYLQAWGEEIRTASSLTEVPVPLLLATLATENGPAKDGPEKGLGFAQPRFRSESGGRVSVGPCHVLLGTARQTMRDDTIDREWLADLENNLVAAASYIRDGKRKTGWDPVLVAARYNSGGIYNAASPASSYHNRWHLRSYGAHLDRFADWYGDALAVLAEQQATPEVGGESETESSAGSRSSSLSERVGEPVLVTPRQLPRQLEPIEVRRVEALYSAARAEHTTEDEFRKAVRILAHWLDDVLSDVPWYARAVTVLRSLRKLIRALT